MSTVCIDKTFHLPVVSNFLHGSMDQEIDFANIRGLVSSNFFIMTWRVKRYFATHVTGIGL